MSTARPIRATRSMITHPSAPNPVASVRRGANDVSAQRSVRSAPQASARTPSSFQVVDGVNSEEAVEPVEPAVDAIKVRGARSPGTKKGPDGGEPSGP